MILKKHLYFNELPTLEIKTSNNTFNYCFKANVPDFEMPIALNIDG